MKKLIFSSREATFKLDGIDIGDYIEAEFVSDLGIVDEFDCMGKPTPVIGYELLLTFSAIDVPPEAVEMRIGGFIQTRIMKGRTQGEHMVMRPVHIKTGRYEWNQLVVNGEFVSGFGRSKVSKY